MAAAALAKCGNAKGLTVLREILADPVSPANRLAAWALGQVGDSSDIGQLHTNLPHIEAPQVRCFHEMALAGLGDPAGKTALIENLASEDPSRRVHAANFAGEDAHHRHSRPPDNPFGRPGGRHPLSGGAVACHVDPAGLAETGRETTIVFVQPSARKVFTCSQNIHPVEWTARSDRRTSSA